ncbi:MAG: hypothetical protein Kow0077_23370 [Anaerolineae bacterium]
MLRISELSAQTGVPARTIRYYESIDLLPEPARAPNGYRLYDAEAVERLNFVRRARALDFTLDDITEILAFRERGEPPCRVVLALLDEKARQITARIRELETLQAELEALSEQGRALPEDALMQNCVCHLIQTGTSESQPYTERDDSHD